ncbi:hypothetical protein FRC02_008534 [Tulasnella sp. 418]|nr:hypothetical protein FRC02_008534 [Tulasnella sp. 418]
MIYRLSNLILFLTWGLLTLVDCAPLKRPDTIHIGQVDSVQRAPRPLTIESPIRRTNTHLPSSSSSHGLTKRIFRLPKLLTLGRGATKAAVVAGEGAYDLASDFGDKVLIALFLLFIHQLGSLGKENQSSTEGSTGAKTKSVKSHATSPNHEDNSNVAARTADERWNAAVNLD